MPYYKTCPHCGDNLDPGERCLCRKLEAAHNHTDRDAGRSFKKGKDYENRTNSSRVGNRNREAGRKQT